ncbi:MAG: 4Fe-4S dicluster domain-containing protein [Eubacterium sp.]|nr:4Fe-4S dicluster domain-containing protein [Eubacterium sp.]
MTHTYYYELMMQELEKPYCRFENRDEFIEAFRLLLTPQQAEVWLAFPDFSLLEEDPPALPLSAIRSRIRPELNPDLISMVKDMEKKIFLVCMGERAGEKVYMRNYVFGLAKTYVFKKGHPLEKPCTNWFYNVTIMDDMRLGLAIDHSFEVTLPHEGALTGNSRHGKIPMNLKIPDTREIVPYDLASKAVEEASRCAVRPCICRQVAGAKGTKECSYEASYCIALNEVADASIASGEGIEKTKEKTLDILKKCRDMGMVQQINNANHPYSICNCCKDCCLCLISLAKGERKISKPSRFVASAAGGCIQCGICMKFCPMEAIRMTIGGALVIPRQCIGCGVCVSKCPKGALTLLRKDPDSPKEREIPKEKRPYL